MTSSNVSGQITFGTKELPCGWCKEEGEHQFPFVGRFGGQPVSGTYFFVVPAPNSLSLSYYYHHHKVDVDVTNLNITNPTHMKMSQIIVSYANDFCTKVLSAPSCCQAITGLHIHAGDIIKLVKAETKTTKLIGNNNYVNPLVGRNDCEQELVSCIHIGNDTEK